MKLVSTLSALSVVALVACNTGNNKKSEDSNLATVQVGDLAKVNVDFTDGVLTFENTDGVASASGSLKFKKADNLEDLAFVAGTYKFSLTYLKDDAKVLASENCPAALQSENTQTLKGKDNKVKVHVCEGDGLVVETVTGSIEPVIHGELTEYDLDPKIETFSKRADMRFECTTGKPLVPKFAIYRKDGEMYYEEPSANGPVTFKGGFDLYLGGLRASFSLQQGGSTQRFVEIYFADSTAREVATVAAHTFDGQFLEMQNNSFKTACTLVKGHI